MMNRKQNQTSTKRAAEAANEKSSWRNPTTVAHLTSSPVKVKASVKTMCGPTQGELQLRAEQLILSGKHGSAKVSSSTTEKKAPIDVVLEPPTLLARYACASVMVAIFGVWGKICFTPETEPAPVGDLLHSWKVPTALTVSYLLVLPLMRIFSKTYLSESVDVKLLLKETMVVYNGGQVILNFWMVYKIIEGLVSKDHPFIGQVYTLTPGVSHALWIHYVDKYLEFFDTFFMVLRGRMDQVSFLHVYHHVSIAWAWWFAMKTWPGGDAYFGALLNSWIHVMMYSYYTLSLLKIRCPWKKYLTQSQLLQFCTVVVYTVASTCIHYQKGEAESRHYWCLAVQSFEMISLFFLFMHFYSKTYKKRQSASKRPSSSSSGSQDGSDVPEQVSISSETSDEIKKDM